MATPAERKALFFIGVVALLGASVRLWRARSHPAAPRAQPGFTTPASPRATRAVVRRNASGSGQNVHSRRSRLPVPLRDSTSIVDLDRATAAQIERLGVLPRGLARLLVEDRERYGPFGSLEELTRVSVLTPATIRRLAPRVTFSLLPRPRNAVIQPRPEPRARPERRPRRARSQAPLSKS